MAHKGKIQLMFTIIAPPDQVEEGDRIFRSHAPWIEATHHRTGDKALLSYDVSKAPELKNPLDPSAGVTGNTCYVLTGISIFAGPGWTPYTRESRSAHENRFHRTIVQVLRPSLSPR